MSDSIRHARDPFERRVVMPFWVYILVILITNFVWLGAFIGTRDDDPGKCVGPSVSKFEEKRTIKHRIVVL